MSERRQTRILELRGFAARGRGWRVLGDDLSRGFGSLQSEELCAEARRRSRLEDFGDPPVEPALSILVNSLEHQADLHPLGRFLMRIHLLELLETRLRLVQVWTRRSEALAASPVQRPIFITGMPRSGSTFLHELLAEDPEKRAPPSMGSDVSSSGPETGTRQDRFEGAEGGGFFVVVPPACAPSGFGLSDACLDAA
jgi:sulfotransferase family protein